MRLFRTGDNINKRSQKWEKTTYEKNLTGIKKDIKKSTLPICMKHEVYNECIIPDVTMMCETWEVRNSLGNKIKNIYKH